MTQFKLGYGAAATVILLIAVLDRIRSGDHPAEPQGPNDRARAAMDSFCSRRDRFRLDHPDHRRRRHLHAPARGRHPRLVASRQPDLHAQRLDQDLEQVPIARSFVDYLSARRDRHTRDHAAHACCGLRVPFPEVPLQAGSPDHHHQRLRAAAAGRDHSAVPALAADRPDRQLSHGAHPLCRLELRLVDLPGEELPRGFSEGAHRGRAHRRLPANADLLACRAAQHSDADLRRRHPAVPLDVERAAATAALPAHQRSSAGPLRPHRRYIRSQLGSPVGRCDHHHYRPAHRLPRVSAAVRRRRAGSTGAKE